MTKVKPKSKINNLKYNLALILIICRGRCVNQKLWVYIEVSPKYHQAWAITLQPRPAHELFLKAKNRLKGGAVVNNGEKERQRAVKGMGTTTEEVRTLWIGDLQYWVEESYLTQCFAHTGDVLSIKIIRNKLTGQSEGYGFVEFVSHAAAERILQTYNGTLMPGTEQAFRLNWASSGGDSGPDHSIFVGDLAPDVTDYLLMETFRPHYPSVRGAKVVIDPATGRSKGYGFVKFSDENQRNRAMTEMNGAYCSTRAMRISAATPKKTTGFQHQFTPAAKGFFFSLCLYFDLII